MAEDGFARLTLSGMESLLAFRGFLFRAAIGKGGVRADKAEGDGATPAALLPLRRVLYRADRVATPQTIVAVEPLSPQDGWCDEPGRPDYNRLIRLPSDAHHEELWRTDQTYDVIGVLGWNDDPVKPGRGSAIFLHVSGPNYAPTEGCVALEQKELMRLLAAGCRGIDARLS